MSLQSQDGGCSYGGKVRRCSGRVHLEASETMNLANVRSQQSASSNDKQLTSERPTMPIVAHLIILPQLLSRSPQPLILSEQYQVSVVAQPRKLLLEQARNTVAVGASHLSQGPCWPGWCA